MNDQFDDIQGQDQPVPRRRKRKKRNPFVQIMKVLLVLLIFAGIVGGIGAVAYTTIVLKNIEPIDATNITSLLGENSVILDSKGKVLETIEHDGFRKIVKYSEISPNVVNAYVAVEDKTFWEHKGFNYVRLIGSVWDSITKGSKIKGTSTISQQLARNIYLVETKSSRTLERKIKEAYYAKELENQLSKEQIMEAYLNTIYLGSGTYGIEAAAKKYFNKSAKDLDIVESAILAGLNASPSIYGPLRKVQKSDVSPDDLVVDDSDEIYTVIFNKNCEKRYRVAIKLIYDNGYINASEYEAAKNVDLRTKIHLGQIAKADITSYFGDMVKNDVVDALMAKYNISKDEAQNILFTKGLQIQSTIDYDLQKKVENAYANIESNRFLPKVDVRLDRSKNIISENGTILLYSGKNLVNAQGQFFIPKSDYEMNKNGDLVLNKGRKLYFYPSYQDTKLTGVQAVIKNSYKYSSGGALYSYTGHELAIPNEFKSLDESGNLVISRQFLEAKPDFFRFDGSNNIVIDKANYAISEKGIVQPQSAMVILDYHTGQLKAIVGGINVAGQKIYNRALNPRQPGSSIKPLAVYLPGIDTRKITAGTVFDDAPTYLGPNHTRWPFNWYESSASKYWGLMTIREAVEWSNNVIAAKVAQLVGVDTSISYLKKLGISTLVTKGPQNDGNLSAMSLGGMTRGVTPIDITGAYGAIANGGKLMKTITFTKVTDNTGKVVLEQTPEGSQVVDKRSAYIMQDIMRTNGVRGLGKSAAIRPGNTGIPIAGKTGTTSNKMDAWFVGYTPYYVAATWFGNDWNMPLNEGSAVSAKFWRKVMVDVHEGLPNKDFPAPEGLTRLNIDTKSGKLPTALSNADPRGTIYSEWFIPGTEPSEADDVHVSVAICKESGKLATPNCPTNLVENRVFTKRKEPYDPAKNNGIILKDWAFEAPTEKCPIHSGQVVPVDPNSNGSQTSSASVKDNGDGTVEVVKPFTVTTTDGRQISLPRGTQILSDFTISMPDGTILQPGELSSHPDLETLKGNPSH